MVLPKDTQAAREQPGLYNPLPDRIHRAGSWAAGTHRILVTASMGRFWQFARRPSIVETTYFWAKIPYFWRKMSSEGKISRVHPEMYHFRARLLHCHINGVSCQISALFWQVFSDESPATSCANMCQFGLYETGEKKVEKFSNFCSRLILTHIRDSSKIASP